MFNAFKISKYLLYLVPLMVIIVTPSTLFPFIVGKYVFFRTIIGLSFIFFLLGVLLNQNGVNEIISRLKQLIKNPLIITVSIFAAIFLLACLFGVSPSYSFWSNFERGEGGLQILCFYIFFALLALLFDKEKDWRIIFTMMIIGAIGISLYGVAAGLKYVDADFTTRNTPTGGTEDILSGTGGPYYQMFHPFIGLAFSNSGFRFEGSIGNSSYVAAYIIFSLFYISYLLVSKYKNKLFSYGAIALWVSALALLIVFFMAGTRGAFLGLIASVLAFLACLAFSSKRWRKWIILAGAVMVVLVFTLVQFKDTPVIKSVPGVSRILSISLSANTFQDRVTIWKMAIDGFKERPILGWGPENFLQVFDHHFNIKYFNPNIGFGAWFDRAHNIYLDYLAETGILGLLSYLGIFIAFYYLLFKKPLVDIDKNEKNQNKLVEADTKQQITLIKALMFAIPVAYLVQGIVLFDVSPIYLNLFLLFAFAVYKSNFKNKDV
ncbi:MAG: O-antigen ligase family protein [Candidatus Paceibacterota bacterium]